MYRISAHSSSSTSRFTRFVSETDGTITVESVIALPLLMFWYVLSFCFFDGFRVMNVNEKAAYTISDLITRTQPGNTIDQSYINGMNDVFDYLVNYEGNTWIRVTSIKFDETQTTNKFRLEWSGATHSVQTFETHAELNTTDMINRLPTTLGNGETVILIETSLSYNPPFNIDFLQNHKFRSFTYTSPRFLLSGITGHASLKPVNPGS